MFIRNLTFSLALLATVFSLTGCEDITGLDFGGTIELYTSTRSYAIAEDGHYACEYIISVDVPGSRENSYNQKPIEWQNAVIDVSPVDSTFTSTREVLTRRQTEALFGTYLRRGTITESRPLEIWSESAPFDWTLTAVYYDPNSQRTRETQLTRRCSL